MVFLLTPEPDGPIDWGMPGKSKHAADTTKSEANQPASQPVRLFVRRGALRRYDALKRKTSELDVVVAWDRREGERRTSSDGTARERRKNDRRQETPFTWQVADFAVVVSSPSDE